MSNSRTGLAAVDWRKTWLLALLLVALFLVAYERFWRAHGFVPSVTDDQALWNLARSSVKGDDYNEIVLIGDSQMRENINPSVFAELFNNRKPVQLALDGSGPLAVLRNLSDDESFKGVVICDVLSWLFFSETAGDEQRAEDVVRAYKRPNALTYVEKRLRLLVESNFVFSLPELSPASLFRSLRERQLPKPKYNVNLADRTEYADYTKTDNQKIAQYMLDRVQEKGAGISEERLQEELKRIEEMVSKIQARGGRVIFVVLPTTGAVHAIEEQKYPREKYWDVMAAHTKAIAIHCSDYPSLSNFNSPDGLHLDYHDAKTFTRNFALIIKDALKSNGFVNTG